MDIISNKSTIEKIILFVLAPILILLIGFFPQSILLVIVFSMGLWITLAYILKSNVKSVYFIFLISIFQNFITIILMGPLNISAAYYLQYYKEFFLILLIAYLFLFKSKKNASFNPIDLVSFLIIFYMIAISLWVSDGSLFGKMASLRQIIIPFLFYLLGKHIIMSSGELKKFTKKVIGLGIILVTFGVFEGYIYPTFWQDMKVINFFLARRGEELLTFIFGVPLSFYTHDFQTITGGPVRRIASFVANPPVLGHILGFMTVFLLFSRKELNGKRLTLIFLTMGLLLTLGKGGLLTVLVGAFFYVLLVLRKPLITYLLGCALTIGVIAYLKIVFEHQLSGAKHVAGFTDNIIVALKHPLGSGLGTSGNLSQLYNQSATVGTGESFSGLVMGQLGLIGFLFFFLFFTFIMINLLRLMKTFKSDRYLYTFIGALFSIVCAIFVGGFVTESAISFTSAGIPLFLSSVVINNYKELKEEAL
ncbi:hypothetical protein [Peribacillus muralis]|uniref:hypothetical protein n=1 Tax=Peribacillus muralis TaxID=264697 RepID=UPI003D03E22C